MVALGRGDSGSGSARQAQGGLGAPPLPPRAVPADRAPTAPIMTSRRIRADLNRRMGPSELAIFREVVQDLKRLAPPPLPVSVRRSAPPQDELADSELRKRGGQWSYRIRIHPDAGIHLAIYLLWHEWGHCLGWAEGHPTVTDHDEVWGVCLSRAYRAILPEEPPEAAPPEPE